MGDLNRSRLLEGIFWSLRRTYSTEELLGKEGWQSSPTDKRVIGACQTPKQRNVVGFRRIFESRCRSTKKHRQKTFSINQLPPPKSPSNPPQSLPKSLPKCKQTQPPPQWTSTTTNQSFIPPTQNNSPNNKTTTSPCPTPASITSPPLPPLPYTPKSTPKPTPSNPPTSLTNPQTHTQSTNPHLQSPLPPTPP